MGFLSKVKSVVSNPPSTRRDSSLSRSGSTAKSSDNSHPQVNSTPATRRPLSSNNPFSDSSDAPPPYSPNPNTTPSHRASRGENQSYSNPSTSRASSPASVEDDDKYAFLRQFDTIFLIDDSGSMSGPRWRETRGAIEAIVDICVKYDEDGIDLHFINRADSFPNVKSSSVVREVFSTVEPRGTTPLAKRMRKILAPYVRSLELDEEPKPINLIVITDGVSDDPVETVVEEAAKRLDAIYAVPWQVGIQFFQVGNDPGATRYLEKLDDDLPKNNPGMRDIVDTQPYRAKKGSVINGDGILKTVLGAVNKRLDQKKGDNFHH